MTDSPYVADPGNPTDEELAAAIERGLAGGSLIDAAEFLARQPVNVELFNRTAPQFNCVGYDDGPHYTPGSTCLWCGMTREQIAAESESRLQT